jgi:hybrid cluster-associated redox disulfide protein
VLKIGIYKLANTIFFMISKKDNLKEVVDNFPEVGPVLAKFGLHCVGCHVSAMESIEDGCKAHGLSDKQINVLVKNANSQIKIFDDLPDIKFSKKAVFNLSKKLVDSKDLYVKIIPIFGGFDFETTSDKDSIDLLDVGFPLLIDKKIRRFLKGVVINFDEKKKDFVAKRA